MKKTGSLFKLLACLTVSTLPMLGMPLVAAPPAAVRGTLTSAATSEPLAGARVHLFAVGAEEHAFVSSLSAEDGSYALAEVPADDYRVAVESGGGLYLVQAPVRLAAGSARTMHLSISARDDDDDDDDGGAIVGGKPTGWDNPVVATLLVLGGATIIGLLIEELTDDDPPGVMSPSS